MDTATGTNQYPFNTGPGGCLGGAIWSSPKIDRSTGEVYIATGTIHPQCTSPQPYTLSMIELHASDISYVGSWQLPPSDWIGDSTDFGASPTLFQTKIGRVLKNLVGSNNTNEKLYTVTTACLAIGPVLKQ